ITPKYAEAHCNLGEVLRDKGQFAEALLHMRRGHELGSRNPRWPHPTAQWVKDYESLAELDARVLVLLRPMEQPKDTAERLALARFCQDYKKFYGAAARWYGEVLVAEPAIADDLYNSHRYKAACAAALAGCGQGKDADKLDDKEKRRLRDQA